MTDTEARPAVATAAKKPQRNGRPEREPPPRIATPEGGGPVTLELPKPTDARPARGRPTARILGVDVAVGDDPQVAAAIRGLETALRGARVTEQTRKMANDAQIRGRATVVTGRNLDEIRDQVASALSLSRNPQILEQLKQANPALRERIEALQAAWRESRTRLQARNETLDAQDRVDTGSVIHHAERELAGDILRLQGITTGGTYGVVLPNGATGLALMPDAFRRAVQGMVRDGRLPRDIGDQMIGNVTQLGGIVRDAEQLLYARQFFEALRDGSMPANLRPDQYGPVTARITREKLDRIYRASGLPPAERERALRAARQALTDRPVADVLPYNEHYRPMARHAAEATLRGEPGYNATFMRGDQIYALTDRNQMNGSGILPGTASYDAGPAGWSVAGLIPAPEDVQRDLRAQLAALIGVDKAHNARFLELVGHQDAQRLRAARQIERANLEQRALLAGRSLNSVQLHT